MSDYMKNILKAIGIGVLISVLFILFGIRPTFWQSILTVLAVVAILGIINTLRKLISGGLYSYEWSANFNENSVVVKASKAEGLYINGTLVDEKTSLTNKAIELKHVLPTGEKIIAAITPLKFEEAKKQGRYLHCEINVDGQLLQTTVVQ